jgi:hypothetical protein
VSFTKEALQVGAAAGDDGDGPSSEATNSVWLHSPPVSPPATAAAAAAAAPASSAIKKAAAPVLAVALGGLLKADTVVPHEEAAAAPPNHGASEGCCDTGGGEGCCETGVGDGGDSGGGCRGMLAPRSTMDAHAAWAAQLNEATNTNLAQAASTEVRRGARTMLLGPSRVDPQRTCVPFIQIT